MKRTSKALTCWLASGTLILGSLLVPPPAQADWSFNVGFGNEDVYFSLSRYDYFGYEGFNAGFGAGGPGAYGALSYHDVLGDYGYFTSYGPLGQVWVPYVAAGWRPYTYGRWVWTEYGWTWVAYEPWGYIPHHFGRWAYTDRFGWVWVPGYTWAPAHVEFVHNYDVIGWAPLAPVGFHHYAPYGHGYGYGSTGFNTNVFIFVNQRYFGANNCADYVLAPTYVSNAVAGGRLERSQRGPDRGLIERRIGRRVEVAKVHSQTVNLDGKQVRLVTPVGVEDDIRRNAPKVTQRALDQRFVRERVQKVQRGEVRTNQETIDRVFKQKSAGDAGRRFEPGKVEEQRSAPKSTYSTPRSYDTGRSVSRPSSDSGKRYEQGRVEERSTPKATYSVPRSYDTGRSVSRPSGDSGKRYEQGQVEERSTLKATGQLSESKSEVRQDDKKAQADRDKSRDQKNKRNSKDRPRPDKD